MVETDEKPQEIPEVPTLEQQIATNEDVIDSLQFYSSPIRFNSVLFEGFKLILSKLISIETRITNIENLLTKTEEKKE